MGSQTPSPVLEPARLSVKLESGDVVLTTFDSRFNTVAKRLTNARYTHAMICIDPDTLLDIRRRDLIPSVPLGGALRLINTRDVINTATFEDIAVLRPDDLDRQRFNALLEALLTNPPPYSLRRLAITAVTQAFKTPAPGRLAHRFAGPGVICSGLVTQLITTTPTTDIHFATPDHLRVNPSLTLLAQTPVTLAA